MALKTDFAKKPTLTGELVLLRPVQVADAAWLFAVDPETMRLTGSNRDSGFTLENLESWYETRGTHDDRLDLSIIERATGEWAGEVVLNELSRQNESCGFRILLQGPRFYGRGLGTEATQLVIDYAFGTVGVHRIELEVYDFNPRARHVYEKLGFVPEGTKRDALQWDGKWIDCHCMGLLDRDRQR
ncbi:MAG TPA: GNAT family protein [Streptosporangiaceae bacterium]|nr:GNAT family protein [Streptosporangiaceae bacterium]